MRRYFALLAAAILLLAACSKAGLKTPPGSQAGLQAWQEEAGEETVYPPGVPVLMYHKIGDEPNNDAVISREKFLEQMDYLHQNRYHPISLEELYAYLTRGEKLPPRPVVITFDDGYRDTYEVALPVLKQYGFKSALFIPGMQVGRRLSREELLEMKAAGMEVAAHGFYHRSLGMLSPREQEEEIRKSKEILDRTLGQDTRFFCYPNGSYNRETLRILREAGFVMAFTMEPGWAKPGDNLLALKRIWMGNRISPAHLQERLTREDYPRT